MKALLIAEKPSLMRTIETEYRKMNYPDDITFTALVGHVLTLKYPGEYKDEWDGPWRLDSLPIVPDRFEYKVNPKTRDVFNNIKKELLSGKYDYVINACDAGREGQLIFYSVYDHVGCNLPVKRFWTADLSPKGVQEGLNNLLDDSNDKLTALKESSKLRSQFDWLQGMNLSRAASLKANATIPIGRVMTPTLAIVVNRENEIKNFKPEDFFQIEADFGNYKGLWFHPENNGRRFKNKKAAEKIKNQVLKDKNGKVLSVEEKERKRYPYKLHSLTQLQREANIVYGYTANKTLSIAQSLYQDRKLITYPRTDSEYLPSNIAVGIPDQLEVLKDVPVYGEYIKEIIKDQDRIRKTLNSKRYVDDSKVTDHFAIIPTNIAPNYNKLTDDEINIYNLIIRRLTAIFMEPQITKETNVVTQVGVNHFSTKGSVLVSNGFMDLYPQKSENKNIPALKEGEVVVVNDVEILKGQTTPPSRYTEAKLLELMENVGRIIDDEELKLKGLKLGTPATSGDIIEKLIKGKFMQRKGRGKAKILHPTEFGLNVIDILDGFDIVSPELTAVWEKKLTDIENLKLDPEVFREEMIEYTKKMTDTFIKSINKDLSKFNSKKGKVKQEVIGQCPKCGADAILSPKFIRCLNYKKTCDFIISRKLSGANLTKKDCIALITGNETAYKNFTFKSGKKGTAKLKIKNKGDLEFIFK